MHGAVWQAGLYQVADLVVLLTGNYLTSATDVEETKDAPEIYHYCDISVARSLACCQELAETDELPDI